MTIQKFTAPTAREALAKARMTFGEGTLILSNRAVSNGVEVMATAEEALAGLGAVANSANPSSRSSRPPPAVQANAKSTVEEDATQLAMSTLSFQDYVRERMLRRRQDAIQSQRPSHGLESTTANSSGPGPVRSLQPAEVPVGKKVIPDGPSTASNSKSYGGQASLAAELGEMRAMIEDRFNTLAWFGQAKQNPTQANMMLRLIRAGYSSTLSRAILEKMPSDLSTGDAGRWVREVLVRNLRTDSDRPTIHEEGGIFALTGSTGVGKTTIAAKLAGHCAQTFGPSSVGLITLDTYRVGAHEQLRTFGRMIGVVAHLAHDKAALRDLLGLLSNKKLVLIDTAGVTARDTRLNDLRTELDIEGVKKLLVLNAGTQGDSLEDNILAHRTPGVQQQVVISKVDEAVKLAPVLDASIRHQLVLRGISNGQRVPQDWQSADAAELVQASLSATTKAPFDPNINDLSFFFTDSHGPVNARL